VQIADTHRVAALAVLGQLSGVIQNALPGGVAMIQFDLEFRPVLNDWLDPVGAGRLLGELQLRPAECRKLVGPKVRTEERDRFAQTLGTRQPAVDPSAD